MSNPRPRRHGFTLIEMLIAMGIIALLATLTLAMVVRSKTHADVIRVRSDLATIATGLDAYKADFGDYPRLADPATDKAVLNASPTPPGNGLWLDIDQAAANGTDRGARLLCRALIGPAGAGTANAANLAANPGDDGADGPGFRLRRVLSGPVGNQQWSGRVYGPYLQPDRWKLVSEATPSPLGNVTPSPMYDAMILDIHGNPILYYPATPGAGGRIGLPGGFCRVQDPASYTPPPANNRLQPVYPLYNAIDNNTDPTPPLGMPGTPHLLLDAMAMAYILGDRTGNGGAPVPDGKIDSTEKAVTVEPYLLWTAGPDGRYGFGPDPANPVNGLDVSQFKGRTCDDVCNFDLPADLYR